MVGWRSLRGAVNGHLGVWHGSVKRLGTSASDPMRPLTPVLLCLAAIAAFAAAGLVGVVTAPTAPSAVPVVVASR